MLMAANNTLNALISSRIAEPVLAFQYADDTAFIANANTNTLITLKLVLRLFSAASGLHINYHKSSLVPMNISNEEMPRVLAIMGCQQTAFPVNYLGMPLTVTRPTRQLFMPLIEKFEIRLNGWRKKLISRGGRLQLVNSVLSVIPIYFMACFMLPQWVIQRIDRIRRVFLWGKNDGMGAAVKGISLINWQTVCRPRDLGGLGVADLRIRNTALLLKWWWRLLHDPDSLWTNIISMIRQVGNKNDGPAYWMAQGSFFWSQLRNLRNLFQWCTSWDIGQGSRISFWYDSWGDRPLVTIGSMEQPPPRHRISLKEAAPILQELVPEMELDQPLVFSTDDDVIKWRWEQSGLYSAKSAYRILIAGGMITWQYRYIWKFKTPPTIRIFLYLLLKNKLLTHDIMEKRGFNVDLRCAMCGANRETTLHLFFLCPNAKQIWSRVAGLLGNSIMVPGLTVSRVWEHSMQAARNGGSVRWSLWKSHFVATCWNIWKQRNQYIFRRQKLRVEYVGAIAVQEGALWGAYC